MSNGLAALTEYHHGVRVVEVEDGGRTLGVPSMSVIGLVATADDADASMYPLNKPVLITRIDKAIGKAGKKGTLAKSLSAIQQQAEPFVVVVRVPTCDTEAEQTSATIGGVENGSYTGLHALLAAETQLRIKPRILGAPGLDNQPVTTAMVGIAQKLRAMVYASCWDCENITQASLYRANFGARELMLIWPDFTNWDTTTNSVEKALTVAFAMGLRAKIDTTQGWHKTLSNVPVNGVTGTNKDVFWALQSNSTDASFLNKDQITTLIQYNGYRFWGSRTTSSDAAFVFESATRTAHVLADMMADGHAWAIDKPMSPSLIRDIVDNINQRLRSFVSAGLLIGGRAWYDPNANESQDLKNGKVVIHYDYTPVPPLENLGFVQINTDSYFLEFAGRVAAGA